jgi:hypothetical protein
LVNCGTCPNGGHCCFDTCTCKNCACP